MPDDDWSRQRGAFLSVFFTTLLASAFLFLLFLSCGGLTIQMLLVAVAFAIIGCVHYLWWGRSLDQEVEGTREENRVRDLMDLDQDVSEQDYENQGRL
jgi:hypothetical protein